MSIESVMPSNHLILCCSLLLLPSIFPRIRVFSNELAPHITSGGQSIGVSASTSVLPMNIPADSYACKRLKSIGSKALILDQQNLYHQGSCCLVCQWCPTLCDPMDCSLPRSFVHGIFHARVLEWVAIFFSIGSSQPRE